MAFKPTASKRHLTKETGKLNMNSMMDMVTIILLFLLKSYSTEGALKNEAGDLKLPSSYRTIKPPKAPALSVSKNAISLNGEQVLLIEEVGEGFLIGPLSVPLRAAANAAKEVEEYGGIFAQEILILIDEDAPFDLVFKIINTCAKNEFIKVKLFVQGFGVDDLS